MGTIILYLYQAQSTCILSLPPPPPPPPPEHATSLCKVYGDSRERLEQAFSERSLRGELPAARSSPLLPLSLDSNRVDLHEMLFVIIMRTSEFHFFTDLHKRLLCGRKF